MLWPMACLRCRAGGCRWCVGTAAALLPCRSAFAALPCSRPFSLLDAQQEAPDHLLHMQEDAHIAELDLDPATKTSLFSGACALHACCYVYGDPVPA